MECQNEIARVGDALLIIAVLPAKAENQSSSTCVVPDPYSKVKVQYKKNPAGFPFREGQIVPYFVLES